MASKSYRAVLPDLSEQELARLRQRAADNCSASTISREDGAVVWLASRDRARNRGAFLRSVRRTVIQLGVDVTRLRGRWLLLADDCVVRPPASDAAGADEPAPPAEAAAEPEDSKIIPL